MNFYTKKPVRVKALQYTGDNLHKVQEFISGNTIDTSTTRWQEYVEIVRTGGLIIESMEGDMLASVNDYIIQGIKGEVYPCKPDIFELTYDKVQ